MTEFVSVEGPAEAIEELASALGDIDGLEATEAVPLDAPAGALDAPINPDDIKVVMETITVMLETGTAAAAFWEAIRRVRGRRAERMRVRDGRTGDQIAEPEP